MGLDMLGGLANHPLRAADYLTGAALAAWIETDMPCVIGRIPASYMERLKKTLLYNVPDATVREAFRLLDAKNVQFEFPVNWPLQWHPPLKTPSGLDSDKPGHREPDQYHDISKPDAIRMMHHSIEVYEGKFRRALAVHNAGDAQQILSAVLDLLLGLAKGYGKTRKAGGDMNVKMQEWREWNEAVNEALQRAETLDTHIRRLSRQEVLELRDAESPSMQARITFRLSGRLGMQAVEEEEKEESEREAE